ncbi:MAG: hypothetical protein PHX16_00400 [Syntrophaceticus sp.]|jgi:hypothetical protein|nr:hypothetical protein [Syntrophaceticus sp.]MDD3314603.1 hypothetical protein [Syntrophaceticus sp.]MDD4359247.1 hypothetical protein [Syntrophaceticus sp.]MDD4782095.1 hypothetical protein [Syntrophaceticus sp.]
MDVLLGASSKVSNVEAIALHAQFIGTAKPTGIPSPHLLPILSTTDICSITFNRLFAEEILSPPLSQVAKRRALLYYFSK